MVTSPGDMAYIIVQYYVSRITCMCVRVCVIYPYISLPISEGNTTADTGVRSRLKHVGLPRRFPVKLLTTRNCGSGWRTLAAEFSNRLQLERGGEFTSVPWAEMHLPNVSFARSNIISSRTVVDSIAVIPTVAVP